MISPNHPRNPSTRSPLPGACVPAITLTYRHNAVRCPSTASRTSGVEDYLRSNIILLYFLPQLVCFSAFFDDLAPCRRRIRLCS